MDTKTLELPSGKIAEIKPGKGRDVVAATRVADGDASMMMPALMAQLVRIDGQSLPMEDFLDLPAGDFMKLMAELGGNF